MEQLLEQERADEVAQFFDRVPASTLAISEFSLYSIGIILANYDASDVLRTFLEDLTRSGVHITRLTLFELVLVVQAISEQGLDFDDAYQYVAATTRELDLVSFDSDFDRTDLVRLEPKEVYPSGLE